MLTMTVLLVALALGASEDLLARLSFFPSVGLLLPTLAAGVRRNRDRAPNRQERHLTLSSGDRPGPAGLLRSV